MKLTEEDILEFKNLYKKYFEEELSDEEALERGMKLIRLIKAVLRPPY